MNNYGINIAIIGKTGVGKSTFCNYIFGSDVFTTGSGKPVTGWDQNFKHHSIEHENFTLNIYDSVGIENDKYDKWKGKLKSFIYDMGPDSGKKPMEWLHACMYLINAASARVEAIEKQLIKELSAQHVPITIILTNCDSASTDQKKALKHEVQSISPDIIIVESCSVSVRKRGGNSTAQFGKEEALGKLLGHLDSKLRKKLINYYLDEYSRMVKVARHTIFRELDIADIGFLGLIKGIIRDGESFELDSVFPDIDLLLTDDIDTDLLAIDDFLLSLGYASNFSEKTHDIVYNIRSEIEKKVESIGSEMEKELSNIINNFEGGNFFDKFGAAFKTASVAINLRGFMKNKIDLFCDSILNFIKDTRHSI